MLVERALERAADGRARRCDDHGSGIVVSPSSGSVTARLYALAPTNAGSADSGNVGAPVPAVTAWPAWSEVESAEPAFAARVRALLDAEKHKTIATLRADGGPRISGIEVAVRRRRAHLRVDARRAQGRRSAPRSAVRPAQRLGGPAGGRRGRRGRAMPRSRASPCPRGRSRAWRVSCSAPTCARSCSPCSRPRGARPCASSRGLRAGASLRRAGVSGSARGRRPCRCASSARSSHHRPMLGHAHRARRRSDRSAPSPRRE